jgi:hypothetical protein
MGTFHDTLTLLGKVLGVAAILLGKAKERVDRALVW